MRAPPPLGRRAQRRHKQIEQNEREYEDSDSEDSDETLTDVEETTLAHRILGLQARASRIEVRGAYIALARLSHPDKGGDIELFKRVQHAYEQLMR